MNTVSSKRQMRTRKKLRAMAGRPRLSVFRSNKFLYAQIIDDESGKTLIGASEKQLKETGKTTNMERAKALGTLIAGAATKKKIKTVVFDKGRYAYHGRVKALAEGAREGGLAF